MKRKFTGAIAAAITALALCAGASAPTPAVAALAGQSAPLAAGQLAQITVEPDYPAFPDAVELGDGSVLLAYRAGSGHASPDGKVKVRRSVDGDTWTEPRTLATESGYAYGPAGLAAETMTQGGRVYMTVVRYTSTGPNSGTDFRPYLSTSDDDGATWTTLRSLPQPVPGWSYPSGLIVTTSGDIVLSEYVRAAAAPNRWSAYYYRSSDRGASWSAMGVLSHATRDFQEPQLIELADGRVFTALRSDSGGYDYVYSAVFNGTWSVPKAAIIHATGNPRMSRTPGGQIALSYRGYDGPDEATAAHRPARLAMFYPDGSTAYRGGIDVLGGNTHRSLYGRIVAVPGGHRFVTALESEPDDVAPPTSAIYSLPVRFAAVPSW